MSDKSQEVKQGSAQKPNEEGLTTFLSDAQCADLIVLIATITEHMRKSIEGTFDPTATLNQKLLANSTKDEDEKILDPDIDPSTVDVSAFEAEKKLLETRQKELSAPPTKQLKEDALKLYDEWRTRVLERIGEVVNSTSEPEKQITEVAKNYEAPQKAQPQPQEASLQKAVVEKSAPKLEDIFPRVRTSLTKLSIAKRALILHSVILLLISLEHYSARSRVLLLFLTSSLKVSVKTLQEDEQKVAKGLLESARQINADQEAQDKVDASKSSRKWKVAAATAAGAAVVGVAGGIAAPMVASGVGAVMGGLGLGSSAAAGYLGTVAGSTYLVGGLFGAYGGKMTGQMMENLSREVEDFAFLPVHGRRKEFADDIEAAADERRLRVTIGITGWLTEKDEIIKPWRVLSTGSEVFALRWELETLINLGNSINTMLGSAAWGYAQSQVIRNTVFAELMSSVMWPMGLVKVARVVDNPFTLAKSRADKAGEVLADALVNKAQGERSVTLIGYSLGARVIYSCLMRLAQKKAFGLVESAILIGAPTPSDTTSWRILRSACTGRLINVYSENDRVLAFLYRTSSIQYGIAGLAPIKGLPGIENVDVSETVSGHLRYRFLVGKILQKIGLQDIDKEEVKKEELAFEKMLEEEKEQDYIRQAKEKSQSYLGKKEVSDKDAEKEAGDMENEIQQKNEKSMMQWATEQLYITTARSLSPDDIAAIGSKVLKSGSNFADRATVAGSKATKEYYQRARDSLYLSRSGSKNENLAKEGISEIGPGYLQQAKLFAALYLPSWHSKTGEVTGTAGGATKDVTKTADAVTGESKGYIASAASYLPSWSSKPAGAKDVTETVTDAKGHISAAQDATTDKTGELSKEVVDSGSKAVTNATSTLRPGVGGAAGKTDSSPEKAEGNTSEIDDKVMDSTDTTDNVGKAGAGAMDKTTDATETGLDTVEKAPEQIEKGFEAAGNAVGKLNDTTGVNVGTDKASNTGSSAGESVGANNTKGNSIDGSSSAPAAATNAGNEVGETTKGVANQTTNTVKKAAGGISKLWSS